MSRLPHGQAGSIVPRWIVYCAQAKRPSGPAAAAAVRSNNKTDDVRRYCSDLQLVRFVRQALRPQRYLFVVWRYEDHLRDAKRRNGIGANLFVEFILPGMKRNEATQHATWYKVFTQKCCRRLIADGSYRPAR